MIELICLDIYSCIFSITDENNKFELHTGPLYDELSSTTLKDKIAEVLGLSDISSEDLEHKILGPDFMKFYKNFSIEKTRTDGYRLLSKRYLQSLFRDFDS